MLTKGHHYEVMCVTDSIGTVLCDFEDHCDVFRVSRIRDQFVLAILNVSS